MADVAAELIRRGDEALGQSIQDLAEHLTEALEQEEKRKTRAARAKALSFHSTFAFTI